MLQNTFGEITGCEDRPWAHVTGTPCIRLIDSLCSKGITVCFKKAQTQVRRCGCVFMFGSTYRSEVCLSVQRQCVYLNPRQILCECGSAIMRCLGGWYLLLGWLLLDLNGAGVDGWGILNRKVLPWVTLPMAR